MLLGCPRAKHGLCHYDIMGGGDPSLIRYSSKTAEQNFMKLSGIVHYMMLYCTFHLKFLFEWFWGFPEQSKDFAIMTWGSGGYHFVSIAHSISSLQRAVPVKIIWLLLETPCNHCKLWIWHCVSIGYFSILCCRFLEYAVTDGEVRKQDGTSVISAVGRNVIGRPIAWNFVRSRWNYIMKE